MFILIFSLILHYYNYYISILSYYNITIVLYSLIPVCKLGYEGSPGSCTKCSIGTYRDALNMSSCVKCPTGKSTLQTGADSLDKCGKNYIVLL